MTNWTGFRMPLFSRLMSNFNRLKIALRNAANAIGNLKDTHLSDFFRKVLYRKGRTAAVSATARKLAVIIWNMIVKWQTLQPTHTLPVFRSEKKNGTIKKMKKQIHKFEITGEELEMEALISKPKFLR